MDTTTILQKLQDPDGALSSLCSIGVDHILSQPLETFLDVERLAQRITEAMTGPGLEPSIAQHVKPALLRFLARAEATDERVGVAVPEAVAVEIEAYLSNPVKLKRELVQRVVDAKEMRGALSTVIQESLGRFLKADTTAQGKGGSGGLFGLAARSAGALRDVGKSMLGGIGDEIEKQIQKRSREAMDSSMSFVQEKLVDYLMSEESSKTMGKVRAQGFRRSLRQKVADAKLLPLDMILSHVPALLRHNLARPEIQETIRKELQEVLAFEGKKPLKQILEESGLFEKTREDLMAQAVPQALSLVKTEAFQGWLTLLLS
jgi:hypothetical protein